MGGVEEWTLVYHDGPLKGRCEPLKLLLEDAGVSYEVSSDNLYGETGHMDAFRGSSAAVAALDNAPAPVMFPPVVWHRPPGGEEVYVIDDDIPVCFMDSGVRWKLCLENAGSFQLYGDNRLPPAVQAKILYRSYLYLEQNKKLHNFNQAVVADFNKKLCEETLEEWVKLSNMAGATVKNMPSAMRKVAEAQAAFQACQAWVVKEAMQKLTWTSCFEAGPLPNMQDAQFVSDVNTNIRLPQALRVSVNQYGVKVAAFLLKVWRLLLQHPSTNEMQLRAQNRMKTFEGLYDLVIDSIIEDDVRELQDVPEIATHEDLLRMLESSKDACSLATSLEMGAVADVALEGLLKQLAPESGSPQIVKGRLKNAFRIVEKALRDCILHDGWCGCEDKLRQGRFNTLGVMDVARAMIVCSHPQDVQKIVAGITFGTGGLLTVKICWQASCKEIDNLPAEAKTWLSGLAGRLQARNGLQFERDAIQRFQHAEIQSAVRLQAEGYAAWLKEDLRKVIEDVEHTFQTPQQWNQTAACMTYLGYCKLSGYGVEHPPSLSSAMRPQRRSGLTEAATTLMLRRLPEDWDAQRIVEWLRENRLKLTQIDFLYVPFDKRADCNIELAFINFVDHSAAKKVYNIIVRQNRDGIWNTVVSAGNIQGFDWNLAYFLARFGHQGVWEKDAPLIFRDGYQLEDRQEIMGVYASLPQEIMTEATRFVREESAGTFHSPGSRRRAQQLPWKLGEETEERREAEIAAPTLAMGTNVVEMGLESSEAELLALIQEVQTGAWLFRF
ncbi:unnamed protein product [Symbiodinium sp. KB8]|nr:unnamed protein product [Symbiodinium sp. KB8]